MVRRTRVFVLIRVHAWLGYVGFLTRVIRRISSQKKVRKQVLQGVVNKC